MLVMRGCGLVCWCDLQILDHEPHDFIVIG